MQNLTSLVFESHNEHRSGTLMLFHTQNFCGSFECAEKQAFAIEKNNDLYGNKVYTRYKCVRFLEFQFSLAGQNIKKVMSTSGNCRFIQLKRRLCLRGLICRTQKYFYQSDAPLSLTAYLHLFLLSSSYLILSVVYVNAFYIEYWPPTF